VKSIISDLLGIYMIILFIRLLSSWFPPPSPGPMRTLYNLLYDVTEPVLKPVRGLIPALRLGGAMALDLSPLLAFIVIGVIRRALA
jgi:YggT family protein